MPDDNDGDGHDYDDAGHDDDDDGHDDDDADDHNQYSYLAVV